MVIAGDDFTVRGGANDAGIFEKALSSERMARDLRLPIVRLVDGTGGGGSVKNIETKGHTLLPGYDGRKWVYMLENLATVPCVSLALGSTAGLGAARVAASHYSVIVKDTAQMFVAGPPVVARIGQKLEKNELGGSEIHTRIGAIDDEAESEADAFDRTRRFLSYLPPNVYELPPRGPRDGRPEPARGVAAVGHPARAAPRLQDAPDHRSADGQGLLLRDRPEMWGRSMITGFARLDGWPVAVMANDPYHYAGAWTAAASEKVERFVDLAEVFHLPMVHLVDNPGFLIGLEAEKTGTIRYGAKALAAVFQSTIPWATIIVRKAFGVAGSGHMNPDRYGIRAAWPSGDWGSLPMEGGIEAAYKADIAAAPDPAKRLAEIEARLEKLRSPFRSAETFMPEEIIDPRDTRPMLCEFAEMAAPLRTPGQRAFTFRP